MALDDKSIFTAAKGYIFIGDVGTTAPTPAQITAFDPGVFGGEVQTVTITGTPTGGTFTLTWNGQTTSAIAYNATAAAVGTALRALSNIGESDIVVSGGPLPGTAVTVRFTGVLQYDVPAMTASGTSLTGGTTPAVAITTTTLPNGWISLGHTSREDLPEFGYDGGEAETRGTWQNDALKEVVTEATVDFMNMNLHQFDEANLTLYYGQDNSVSAAPGEFWVMEGSTAAIQKALLMVVVDGAAKIGFYSRKASIRRTDSISMEVDNFAVLPVRATFLKDGTNELFRWISQDVAVNLV